MVAELPGEVPACPVHLVGGCSGVQRSQQAPSNGDIAACGQADCDCGLGEKRGNAIGGVRVGLQFVAALLVCGGALFELGEPGTTATKLFCYDGHSSRSVVSGFIDVRGEGPIVHRDLL